MKPRAKAKESISPISPTETLYGKSWVEETLAAVVGMWRDRRDVDPVEWQHQIRDEWEQNTADRLRAGKK